MIMMMHIKHVINWIIIYIPFINISWKLFWKQYY